jgi:comEA protein
MIWQVSFSQKVTLWILAAAFVIGCGVLVIERMTSEPVALPTAVVHDGSDQAAFKARADSIMHAREAEANRPININTATARQLEDLSGIGPTLAAKIVKYREEHGPFLSVNELDNVSGIGPKRLANIRDRCTVDSL